MVKNHRLDLRIDTRTKENLIKLSDRFECSLTELIEMLANHKFIFIDNKLSNLLKMYGYYLNTKGTKEKDGTKGETVDFED
jgi:hypothetical protein